MTLKRNFKYILIAIILMSIISIFYYGHIITKIYPAFKHIQRTRQVFNSRDFQIHESENFIIKYTSKDEAFVEDIASLAQRSYDKVGQSFNYYPGQKTLIVIYPTKEDLAKALSLPEGQSAMGVYFADVISLLSPSEWMENLDNFKEDYWYNGPLAHEYTHLVVDKIAKSNYPMWFTEGMALYQEELVTGYIWAQDTPWQHQPYSIEQLTKDFNGLNETMAYKRSYEIIRYMANEHGLDNLIKILQGLGQGQRLDSAVEANLGIDLEQLEQNISQNKK